MNDSLSNPHGLSRRSFLKTSSLGAAAVCATAASSTAQLGGGFTQISPIPVGRPEQFLLDRLTFGRNPLMAQQLMARGWTGFLNWQLQDQGEDPILDEDLFSKIAAENPVPASLWSYSPYDILIDPTYGPFPGAQVQGQAPQVLILAGQYAEHQLKWVMTDFLQNVHNTFLQQPFAYLFWLVYLRDVIHANALGKYSDLVKASGKGASMLNYLGQPQSNATNPNENYPRELLELHTVGPLSHLAWGSLWETYSEADVVEVSKILTGWDMNVSATTELGDFFFNPSKHAGGDKFVSITGPGSAGKTYPGVLGAGLGEGEELIEDLCDHPLTALQISYRMVQWFIGDDVTGTYYEPWVRTALAFQNSGGSLKETIRELFNYEYLHQIRISTSNGTNAKAKVRKPIDLLIALKRSTGAKLNGQSASVWDWLVQTFKAGQIPGYWPAPNGYQPQNEKWIGTLQPRIQLLNDSFFGDNGLKIDNAALQAIFPESLPISDYARTADLHVFGGCLPSGEEALITDYLVNVVPNLPDSPDPRRWALFLLFASPSYQYYC